MKLGVSLAAFSEVSGPYVPYVFRGDDVETNIRTIKQLEFDGVDLFGQNAWSKDHAYRLHSRHSRRAL